MDKSLILAHLKETFRPQHIEVIDESHLHHGHGGTDHTENTHFHIIIVAETFANDSLVTRHRRINNALKTAFSKQLHALKITAKSPAEWT